MNEIQAWEHLAKKWDKPHICKSGRAVVDMSDDAYFCLNLCQSIVYLHSRDQITEGLYHRMESTALAFNTRKCDQKFPFTKAGARMRASFCRDQAAKLKRKKP